MPEYVSQLHEGELRARLDRITRRRGPRLGSPQLRLIGPDLDFSYGDQETPFHAASIGKLFTGVVVLQLMAERRLDLETGIQEIIGAEVLRGLVAAGSRPPTVIELLRHESGVDDYYENTPGQRNGLVRELARDPLRSWTPDALLDFTRQHKHPVAAPGEKFRYSDTGFVLLGKTIEALSGESYETAVTNRIIDRLGLERTFLPGRTKPLSGLGANRDTIAPCFLSTTDLSRSGALSCGWAGGGIASTPRELILFSEALHGGQLLTETQYTVMTDIRNRVRSGIHYGAAMMELRYDGFSQFLRNYPRPLGHLGSLGTVLLYSPKRKTHLAMNFHSRREIPRSIRTAILIEGVLRAADREAR